MKKLILILPIILLALTISVNAANCGGAVRCNCGDTVTSNHTMTYDLIGCNATRTPTVPGLKVSSRVTLDCNGHMITSRTGVGFGIWFSSIQYPGVKNCVINNFDNGIRSDSSDFGVIKDNRFNYNTQTSVTFAGLGQSYGFTVKNNLLYDNGGYGLNMYSVTYTVVTGNEMAYNTMGGAYLDGSTGNTLYNNTFYDNGPWNANETSASTGNNWDSGTLKNYWSDFGSNPGYPNTYIIPGPGPGVDRRPRSALVNIDLAIYSNEITIPTNITEGDIVPIRFYVHNNGYAAANNVRINVLIDDNVIFPISNQYIGAHANLSLTTYWTATPGGHTLGIQVDPYDVIPETNEGNNAGGKSFYVEDFYYTYVWIPYVPSDWSDQASFDHAVDLRTQFFEEVTPITNCPQRIRNYKVPLDEYHAGLCGFSMIGFPLDLVGSVQLCAILLRNLGLIPEYDRVIGLANHTYCWNCNGATLGIGQRYIYAQTKSRNNYNLYSTAAHELGHSYDLCDEYDYSTYNHQNQASTCPNPWSETWQTRYTPSTNPLNNPCNIVDSQNICNGVQGICCGSHTYINSTMSFPGGFNLPDCRDPFEPRYSIMSMTGISQTTCGFSRESYFHLSSSLSCTNLKKVDPNNTATIIMNVNLSANGHDSVSIEEIKVDRSLYGVSQEGHSPFHILIEDENNEVLIEKALDIYDFYFYSPEDSNDSGMELINYTSIEFKTQYSSDWNTLKVYKNNTLLLEENIAELLCNNDQMCDNFENYYSCEADCPNSGQDNTCQSEENGICDPDCAEGIDIDCGCRIPSDGLILRYDTVLCDGTYNLENGIFIDSNNISVTCNNCTIIGNKTSFGVSLIEKNNVDISNLKIVNFSTGAYLQNSSQNTIRNVRVQGHTTGINLLYSNSNEIYNNFLTANTNSTLLIDSYSNNVHDNVIQNSNFKGAFLVRSQNNLFYRNVFNNSNNQSAYEDNFSIGNAWNNSITGNNWSDFTANPGYPNFYEIFGPGDGKDYMPNGRVLNTAPRFTPFNNITVREADRVLLDLNATDAENNTLTFYTNASAVLPSEFTFNSTTGLFDWTPTYLDQGNYTIFLNVTDGAQWDYAKLFITVLDVRVGGGSQIFLKPIKKIIDREIP